MDSKTTLRLACLLRKIKISLLLLFICGAALAQFTPPTDLAGISAKAWTSIEFGPDGRLYALNIDGDIYVFKIERTAPGNYKATSTEFINLVKKIPNHHDDGSLFTTGQVKRLATGMFVAGTAERPVLYIGSSDYRMGGPEGDMNLDTNSGIISRLSWKHSSSPATTNTANFTDEQLWEKVDLVRGLPRSEENHMTNGMQVTSINGKPYLLIAVGGFTNAGAPSRNFTKISEPALAAAIISVDLNALAAMPVKSDAKSPQYIYDLPTLDDPTRPNVNGITDPGHSSYNGLDVGDPFGGNDGLNQAMIVAGGPVQIYSPGFRNTYNLVITKAGRLYVTDNGANLGWGGLPKNEGPPVNGISNVTNEYNYVLSSDGQPMELGGDSGYPYNGQLVNNKDQLHLVTGIGNKTVDTYIPGSYYGGHPTPVRANPSGAGWYTHYGTNADLHAGYFRTQTYNPNGSGEAKDPAKALPANWPPVPASMANPIEGDYLNPGVDDPSLLILGTNTNAIMEYTASNLDGAYKGNLFAGHGSSLRRIELNADGSVKQLHSTFVSSSGNNLGLCSQGDDQVFPGTIWIGTLNGGIRVMEPNDYDGDTQTQCVASTDPAFDPQADYDGDCFSNQDEIDNGSDYCASSSFPADNDKDCIADLQDPDDDNDGIADHQDPFQIDLWTNNGLKHAMPYRLDISGSAGFGFFNVGFTGLMTNLNPADSYSRWLDDPETVNPDEKDIVGGAVGVATIFMTEGDALQNTQRKGLQFGVNIGAATDEIVVNARLIPPFFDPKSQGNGKESYGFYVGNGDQDNYIKLVRVAAGLQVIMEDKGTVTSFPAHGLSILPTESMDLFFICKKGNGQVQAAYAIDGGQMQLIGSLFQAPANVANIIQGGAKALAVGVIGSTGGAGNAKFAANYDYFDVKGAVSAPATAIRLNAGGDALTAYGEHFNADQYASGGSKYTNPSLTDIAGTSSKELYLTERYGNFSYNIPLASGTYLLRLHFAEIHWKEAGKRIFSINAEGKTLLSNYDIVAEVGYATAAIKDFEVDVTDGTLNLGFVTAVDNAKISGIEVISNAPAQEPLSVNAGADKSVTLPTNTTGFTASASGGGAVESWQWQKVSGPAATMAGANSATLSLSDLLEGAYIFKVTVNDNKGATASDEVALTVQASTPTGFAAPSNLTAQGVSASQINLAWTDNTADEENFILERSTSSAFTGSVANITLKANSTSYQDMYKSTGVVFYYRIKAKKGTQESAWSNTASAAAGSTTVNVPAAPSNLQATAASSSSIHLSWTDNSENEDNFKLYRASSLTGTYSLIATLPANSSSYTNSGLNANTEYFYQLEANNAAGSSARSNTASAITQQSSSFAAPTNLTAQGVSASQINLAWTDNTADEENFILERSTSSAFTGSVATITLKANSTSYQDMYKSTGVVFYYRIKAKKGTQESTWSNTASAAASASESGTTMARTTGIEASPNTFIDFVNIRFKADEEQVRNTQEYEVQVFDLLGKSLYQASFSAASYEVDGFRLDLSDKAFRSGNLYLILMENKERTFRETIKVMKGW
jgi:uncharacterized protein (DUF736 family)